jgi:hypothetical protein
MRTTVRLSDDLLRRAKRKALAERRTLTSVLEEGLRLVLDEGRKSPGKRRVLPRVCKAGGGLMPGVDPVKLLAADEEEADLEMLRRTSGR